MSSFAVFPAGWEIKEIKDAAVSVIDGDRGKHYPTKAEFFQEEYCLFLNTGNIKEDSFEFSTCDFVTEQKDSLLKKGKLQRHDIVLTTRGTVGSTAYYHDNIPYDQVRINSGMVIFRSSGDLEPPYLYHLLKSPLLKTQYELYSSGAAQPQLPIKDLRRIKLPLPPLKTQRKIAAILMAYDDLIETNKRRIALLEKMAEELYREWFVRMRFPGHQNTKFVKGVPEGWDIKRLGDILELAYGKALKESDREPGAFRVYGSGGIVGSHSKALVKDHGIVVGRKGNVGAVYFSDRGFFPIDTVYYVVSELPLTFLFFLLRSMNFINNDAAVPGLNRNQAYSNQLFYPGGELINQFSKLVDPIFEFKHRLHDQNETLTQTRDLLLPRLISGKLSVEGLDIQFPPSMQMAESSQP
jgi:type I restriction enzyme S subunit